MKQKNLKAKYGITSEEFNRAVEQIKLGNIACSGAVLYAVVDLLVNGDIADDAAQNKIVFKSEEHKQFYNEKLGKSSSKDCYHKALFYTLGITEDTRKHFNTIFDMGADSIIPESVHADWVTGTDRRAMRLAFNLFTCDVPEDPNNARLYTVAEIFDYGCTQYFLQAIALRFE